MGESIDQSQQDISSSSSIQKDPAMVRRDSEWVFEKFLRETTNGSSSPAILEGGGEEEESDVVEMMMDDCNVRKKSRRIVVEGDSHSLPGKSCVPDPEFLKKQLDLACAAAAVAFCRVGFAIYNDFLLFIHSFVNFDCVCWLPRLSKTLNVYFFPSLLPFLCRKTFKNSLLLFLQRKWSLSLDQRWRLKHLLMVYFWC